MALRSHCAGIFCDGLIINKEEAVFREVLAPKVEGTWRLHELIKQYVADILSDSIDSIKIDQMQNDLLKLIDDLKNSENFADEFTLCENGFWSCDLFRNTSYYIAGSRSLYAIFLEKVGAEIGKEELCAVANSFFGISKQWAAFKKLFMMNYYTNRIDKCQTDLIARFENIAQDELSAYDSLRKYI